MKWIYRLRLWLARKIAPPGPVGFISGGWFKMPMQQWKEHLEKWRIQVPEFDASNFHHLTMSVNGSGVKAYFDGNKQSGGLDLLPVGASIDYQMQNLFLARLELTDADLDKIIKKLGTL